jgi:hypothetical protein
LDGALMLTFFTTAKPFCGYIKVIQHNALESWKRVASEVEIIVFGDDAGAAQTCRHVGIRHMAVVRRNSYGTKYLASMYDQARELARYDLLCHVNCDILC